MHPAWLSSNGDRAVGGQSIGCWVERQSINRPGVMGHKDIQRIASTDILEQACKQESKASHRGKR